MQIGVRTASMSVGMDERIGKNDWPLEWDDPPGREVTVGNGQRASLILAECHTEPNGIHDFAVSGPDGMFEFRVDQAQHERDALAAVRLTLRPVPGKLKLGDSYHKGLALTLRIWNMTNGSHWDYRFLVGITTMATVTTPPQVETKSGATFDVFGA